ncbi:MAG: hypothetical protein HYX72_14655 [Acidobacteria bacterium]|nr:hypothetical protein [Acidobacteriota bacterium]
MPPPNQVTRPRSLMSCIVVAVCLSALTGVTGAGQLPGNRWDLLAVSYPPDRDVRVSLGGADKTLTASGTCTVKAKERAASFEIEIKNLPSTGTAGWTGRQYVLWAIDNEKRAVNLGLVPQRGKSVKWSVEVPFRAFGLLVTAERDAKATAPGPDVAMESLLPTNPNLVVPVYRVEVALAAPQS